VLCAKGQSPAQTGRAFDVFGISHGRIQFQVKAQVTEPDQERRKRRAQTKLATSDLSRVDARRKWK
jgi:hypothetical protein